jgi:hypothetical protein
MNATRELGRRIRAITPRFTPLATLPDANLGRQVIPLRLRTGSVSRQSEARADVRPTVGRRMNGSGISARVGR